jgi:hypothetical protein
VRLDHLLSRENRVPTRGGVGALMAPRLIARSFAFPQPGGARRIRKDPEIDCDLARNTEPVRADDADFLPLFKG